MDGNKPYMGFADLEVNSSAVEHIPVRAETLAERIHLPKDGVMDDATIGQGGHGFLFGRTLGPAGVLIGLDVDKEAIQRAHFKLKNLLCKVILIRANFSQISEQLSKQGIEKVDFILADLGLCSAQMDTFIVRGRQGRPITTTGQLAAIICKALQRPGTKRWTRIHPATRTFQALRIAVNGGLENLHKLR